jgi:hypothetical protein
MANLRSCVAAFFLAALAASETASADEFRLGEWRVVESRIDHRSVDLAFDGPPETATRTSVAIPMFLARYERAEAPPGPPFDVSVLYGAAIGETRPEAPWPREQRKRLAEWTFPLEGAPPAAAKLALSRYAPLAGKGAGKLVFELRAGSRLEVSRSYDALDTAGEALKAALEARDEKALRSSEIARLASALLTAKGPIGPAERVLDLTMAVTLREAEGARGTVARAQLEDGADVLRISARRGQLVVLAPVVRGSMETPHADRLESHAIAPRIVDVRFWHGSQLLTGSPPAFPLGPFTVEGERAAFRIMLEGDRPGAPAFGGEILFSE